MTEAASASVLRHLPRGDTAVRLAARSPVPAARPADQLHVLAREEAAAEAARQAFERGQADGFEQGLSAGREEGLRLGLQEAAEQGRALVERAVRDATQPMRDAQEHLHRLAGGLRPAFAACLAAAEDELVALCYETICSILGEHALQPAVVQAHVEHVLSLASGGQQLALHLHPQDVELLASCELRADASALQASIHRVADPQVALGGCIVRGPQGGLDARLETALLACKEALLSARRNHQPVSDMQLEACP
jgi:flagellar assembly protein FliH